ncbi:hypothetical protein [Streptomyces purpureus]|uniref:Lipoprotein n=1 Tax=Streptomyces purpureus TaxID=1951 RepID=A0A918GZK0_9ACTN|nr:lipoprotein [Streptomyces purpureus]
MRTERTVAAAVLAALMLVTGCDSAPEAPEEATGTLEELAAKAECEPNIQTDAEELRQANCRTADGNYILTTFATDRGQREWINESKDYGGSYLVGRKWVVAGEAKVVTAVRGRLGGTVETAPPHQPHRPDASHSGAPHGETPKGHTSHGAGQH